MTIPNLIGVFFLTATLKTMTNDYFSKKHITYEEYMAAKGGGQ
jgi:Na+/alanine symporter